MQKGLRIMIVAGEPSGDSHASDLVHQILEKEPNASFFGSAGPKMRAAGVEAIVEADTLSVVGVGAVTGAIPMFLSVLNKLKKAAAQRNPDAVILVDFPEFNLKLARSLKKRGHFGHLLHLAADLGMAKISIRTIRRHVDLLVSILPFEKEWYASQGVDHVVNVGNPLVGQVRSSLSKAEFCSKHGLTAEDPIIALLPGSRSKEITRILPEMLAAASRMADADSSIQFVIALGPNRTSDEVALIRKNIADRGQQLPKNFTYVQNETYEALSAADAAAVTSGTATLEAGILGTPMAVVYKVPRLDYRLLKPFVQVPHIGLINLIAGERLAKELIQDEFTAQALSDELLRLLDPHVNAEMRARLHQVSDEMQAGGSDAQAGEVIIEFIKSKSADAFR
jgi:lipid-A-disaccharide synthase